MENKKKKEIKSIEEKIRDIFTKDIITSLDIEISKKLLIRWKFLTEYISDKTPVMKHTVDKILDNEPDWQN